MKKTIACISVFFAATSLTAVADIPYGYYSTCNGLTGKALLEELAEVVGPHTTVSYDGLWSVYPYSDVDSDGRIWDMYSTKRWRTDAEHCGSYKYVGDCYNREHSFPKSWFNNRAPMSSDAFHVYPTDGKVNGQRSNFPYGECANGTSVASHGSVTALGKLGASTFSGYSGTVFEPDDQYKGDFARTYFYMATAYNSGIKNWDSPMLAGNSYPAFSPWAVEMLLKWHRQDPVSAKEIERNEAVYNAQKNRNPYIDHPELAEYIWGSKNGEKWDSNSTLEPKMIQPVDGATIAFGTVATNYMVSRELIVKGSNIKGSVSLSVDSPDFKLSKTSVSVADANSIHGATLSVSVYAATPGSKTAHVTVKAGDITAKVTVTASVIDGIPALPATNITEDSFTARWIDLDDYSSYTLTVYRDGTPVDGYPRSVNAAQEEHEVDALEASTTYTYDLSSPTKRSNTISVTTASLNPSIQYLGEDDFTFNAQPGEPSDYAEIFIDVDNIHEDVVATVDAPFQLSTDLTNWSRSIVIDPMDDHFYVRVLSDTEGSFEDFIVLTAGDYINDNARVTASVRDSSQPWFVEDFELATDHSTYSTQTYEGRVMTWTLSNSGVWSSDSKHNGKLALRLGSNSTSSITATRPKDGGIGLVTLQAARWSESDGDFTLSVETSEDGTEWTDYGTMTVTSDNLQPYTVAVNQPGALFLRIRQIAGKRGMIDDIVATDYSHSGIAATEETPLWDAYNLGGELVIDNHADTRHFLIYNIEGKTLLSRDLPDGKHTLRLSPGVYFVSDLTDARRVIIH